MKKSLLALAALGAFTGAAHAQSSVTLYGVVDANIEYQLTDRLAIFAAGRAPAYAQGASVHWLRWNDFVPVSDQLLKGKITQECLKATGIKLNVETINANDLQPRITAAIQSGSGADIIQMLWNWPHLYQNALVDVGDVAEPIGKEQGGFYDVFSSTAKVGGKWLAVPHGTGGNAVAYRRSWHNEVGAKEFPKTWDEWRQVGKKLKAKGRPIGQALGHSFGDPPTFSYPLLWSFGGAETDPMPDVGAHLPPHRDAGVVHAVGRVERDELRAADRDRGEDGISSTRRGGARR